MDDQERTPEKSVNNLQKFCLLMWKNRLLQLRHKKQTIIEILVPLLFTAVLMAIRNNGGVQVEPNAVTFKPLEINKIEFLKYGEWKLVYSPKSPLFEPLLEHVMKSLSMNGTPIGVDDPQQLLSVLTEDFSENPTYLAGVQFDHFPNITELPKKLSYSLRFSAELRRSVLSGGLGWQTIHLFPTNPKIYPRNSYYDEGAAPCYSCEGFIQIQNAIARAFVNLKSNSHMPEILLQRFPYPPFKQDRMGNELTNLVAMTILAAFVYPCINTVRFIAIEKEKQLKEAMRIMGLPNWLHWTSWFVRRMIFMLISITFMTIYLKVSYSDFNMSVFTKTHWTVLWMFLFVYSISVITFCFMMSVFFSKANIAATVASLMWFISSVPFLIVQSVQKVSLLAKLIVCLSTNSAMIYGIQLMRQSEEIDEGINWSNLWQPVTKNDKFTLGMTMVIMFITSCLYLLIALYVEKVMPGSYGVPEPWYFPFTKDFWCGAPENQGIDHLSSRDPSRNPLDYEADPQNRRAGIQVKKLRKVYSNQKVAVNGLSINMFDDQITVLLGHNGAGKTTTMSMLTGMFQPTSGTALINGYDIRSNICRARGSMGLCPQHNILFDELTVREHIMFYSRLKGLDAQAVKEEVNKYVQLLELEPKIDAMSSTLSGGMKRKLSVGVALCGRSKVVLCDEPSSGMDPAARRALWDLLQSEKKGRTILLSTHFMDEADVLGDRIAIMADGELKCYGTSFFLKKRFGTGYHLICVKDDDCDSNDVTNFLQRYLPDIQVESEIGSELSYQLPDEQIITFGQIFKDLEENQNLLRLGSFGVSLTTMEDVFLKVGTESTALDSFSNGLKADNGKIHGHIIIDDGSNIGHSNTESIGNETLLLLRGRTLTINQLYAMLQKRFKCWMRSWIMYIIQILIPVIFIVISVMATGPLGKMTNSRPLEISLSTYEQSVTILQRNPLVDPNSLSAKIIVQYQEMFKQQPPETNLTVITEDFQTNFLKLANTSKILDVNALYLAAATIGLNSSETIVAWFNNEAFHTAPLAVNLVHNAIIRATIDAEHSIRLINAPLPFSMHIKRETTTTNAIIFGLSFAICVEIAMAYVSAFYVIFYIKERISKAKFLQFVSGVDVFTFWLASFLWDFATYLFTALLLIFTLAAFQKEGFAKPEELGRLFAVLILFGFAMLPQTFILSKLFTAPSGGFSFMVTINMFTGLILYPFSFIDALKGMQWVFLALPNFALTSSLFNLNNAFMNVLLCMETCDLSPKCKQDCETANYFTWEEPGVGRNLVYMAASGIAYFIILLFSEYGILEGIAYMFIGCFQRRLPSAPADRLVDDDVEEESRRVDAMSAADLQTNNLVMQKVSKFYGRSLAVNQISIGIKQSECFGLLGVNGAGKTSTFKMLTGDERISQGNAWARGLSLKTNMNDVHKVIGYCPQFDALIEDLTGRETLEMFALLRGVPCSEINDISVRLATELNFMNHIDKKVSQYSGGNRRKLSTAVALIGNPTVVYLDEPTTGMDPGAKRNLWNMINKMRNSGKSIVLTSHSMEECEALCTRLAIMVNGEFMCLGSTQHLKNKFSKGFILTVKAQKASETNVQVIVNDIDLLNEHQANVKQIKDFVTTNFPGAFLKDEHQGLLVYYVPPTDNLKWSAMFSLMESGKKTLHIEDYSITQTSLEQVFLSFAKNQL